MKTNSSKNLLTVFARFALLAGLGAILVGSGFALLNWGEQPVSAKVLDTTGEVFYVAENGTSLQNANEETSLYPGNQLVSGLEGGAMVSFFDQGAFVEVYPNTSFTLSEIGDRGGQKYAEIHLIQGEVKISTTTGVIGVRTNYGLAAVGGNSSVMAVTTQNISDQSTVFCQVGGCAFQQDGETYALASGELVTLQQENLPLVMKMEDAVTSREVQELFAPQALNYPDSHPQELNSLSLVVDTDQDGDSVSLQALEGNQENDEVQLPSQQAEIPTLSDMARSQRSALVEAANQIWKLVSYGDSANLTSVIEGTNITLGYDLAAGVVSGFSGCNDYKATLDDNNGDLNVKTLQITKTRCERVISSQEKAFINLLRKVSSSMLVGNDGLILYAASGDQMVFTLAASNEAMVYTRPTALPTSTSAPTATPFPTSNAAPTSMPTSTAAPTSTSKPVATSTSVPTATAMPTSTSAPAVADAFYVSTSGSDSNPGTYDKPWRTIEKAADTLSAGQTAIVLAGTYSERVSISGNGITLQAEGKVQMKGFLITGDNNTVSGFSISDKTENAGVYVRGDSNLVKNNEIFHMKQDGIWFFGQNNVYQGNYIHDILDPSITSDIHADCFQTWAGYGPVVNTVFASNTCDHNRSSGSNQIFMVEAQSGEVRNLVVKNNTFIMYDAGYSPLNVDRKDGQYAISGVQILNNQFKNISGAGYYPIRLRNVSGGEISGNVIVGYDKVWENDGSTNITVTSNTLQ